MRGFRKDLRDAERFIESGMVDPARFRDLVERIPDSEYSRYPNLTPEGVRAAVADFFAGRVLS